MILLLHGPSDYRIAHALRDLRQRLRAADPDLDANTSQLNGAELTPQELIAHATTVPFLAPTRLVIVDGLVRALASERTGRKKKGDNDPLAPWQAAADQLANPAAMPATTTLVFREGEVSKTSAAFGTFSKIADVQEFKPFDKNEIRPWISLRAQEHGASLTPAAVTKVQQLIEPDDLWTFDSELQKLAVYAGGTQVDETMIDDVVSAARSAKTWDLTDALVAGNGARSFALLSSLLADGQHPLAIIATIRGAYRQLSIIKDMRARRASNSEIFRALHPARVPEWKLNDRLTPLAASWTWPALKSAFSRMLEADLSIKRGEADEDTAIQLLVADLCALAPRTAAAARR